MPTQSPEPMPAHAPGGSGKGSAQPCECGAGGRACVGTPPQQQTLAMPAFAGENSGDAGDCQRKQQQRRSLPEGCNPKHHGLGAAPTPPNPTNHLPVAGPRDCRVSTAPVDPGKITQALKHRRRRSTPGLAPPPFPRAGAGCCRLRLPRYRRAPDWPRLSRNSRLLPITPSANKDGRKHLAEAEPCTNVLVRGGGSAVARFTSVPPPAAETNKGEPRASAAMPVPSPLTFFPSEQPVPFATVSKGLSSLPSFRVGRR